MPVQIVGHRLVKLRKSVFEVIADQRNAHQVARYARPPDLGRSAPRFLPLRQPVILATQPDQGQKVLLSLTFSASRCRG